jgi:broad specificity phosphatase PhoE
VATQLILIRHAHVDTGSRLCGTYDVPLSPAGRAQVHRLLSRTRRRRPPHALYTSPLTRAHAVASALGGAWGIAPRVLWGVREIDCGHLEGVALRELQTHDADLWTQNEAQCDDGFRWPGGERYREFRARVLDGFTRIAESHPDQQVAIVTHAGVISQVLGMICGRPAAVWEPDRPGHLTASVITWSKGRPRAVLSFNEADWY